ncbi:hypothetical protein KC19_3G146300 [Ceratodon purpureus]|uniref:Uncharacterized protein n=1 Tax=Ceratodon purpureus TaxID=3225 RepID=A0A8T0IIC0_CERPU|nr:hypothetical protein KC19_3G146300 [Ceratodon purpureus]
MLCLSSVATAVTALAPGNFYCTPQRACPTNFTEFPCEFLERTNSDRVKN